MIKKIILPILILFISAGCIKKINPVERASKPDIVFQYSTKNALIEKDYYRNFKLQEFLNRGNFGIGTLNGVDGELIVANGTAYQVKYDGSINQPSINEFVAFGNCKNFNADTSFVINYTDSLKNIKQHLSEIIGDKLTAIKISGKFNFIKSRSVPKQPKKGLDLFEIIKAENIFEFKNKEAELIGFFIPKNLDIINFPGFHLHVILNDLSGGGHLHDCIIESVKVELDFAEEFRVKF